MATAALTRDQQQAAVSAVGKVALLSHILPPSPSGHAIVLHRLFRDLDPEHYCLLSIQNYDAAEPHLAQSVGQACQRLPARYHHIRTTPYLQHSPWWVVRLLRKFLGTAWAILTRAARIVSIMKRERCTAIIACSGDLVDLPAAYLAACWLRVPFIAYMFDDYTEQWTLKFPRTFARCAWSFLARRAGAVIVPNEFLAAEYQRRYQIDPVLVRNIVEESGTGPASEPPRPRQAGAIRIVYTGAVYEAHFDAFRNLLTAIARLERSDVQLHLFTGCDRNWLESKGLRGPIVYHEHIAMRQALRVQGEADILFLPLAFHSPYPEIVKTSAPGKMGEFLASGRPILVHAPADSFVSWYVRTHDCGVVVDQDDPALLAEAIRRLMDQAELRRRIVRNALIRARTDFAIAPARQTLFELVNLSQESQRGSRS